MRSILSARGACNLLKREAAGSSSQRADISPNYPRSVQWTSQEQQSALEAHNKRGGGPFPCTQVVSVAEFPLGDGNPSVWIWDRCTNGVASEVHDAVAVSVRPSGCSVFQTLKSSCFESHFSVCQHSTTRAFQKNQVQLCEEVTGSGSCLVAGFWYQWRCTCRFCYRTASCAGRITHL